LIVLNHARNTKKKGETMTSKTQFKRMVPGDKILIEAGDQKMLIECHSWKRTILVYRPPTDEEIAEVYQ